MLSNGKTMSHTLIEHKRLHQITTTYALTLNLVPCVPITNEAMETDFGFFLFYALGPSFGILKVCNDVKQASVREDVAPAVDLNDMNVKINLNVCY